MSRALRLHDRTDDRARRLHLDVRRLPDCADDAPCHEGTIYDAVHSMTLPAGTRVGPYEILGSIGAGGMGAVYRARDSRLDRDVAVKVLSGSTSLDASAAARLLREAKAVAAISHPNVLGI